MHLAIIGCGFIGRKRAQNIPKGHTVTIVVDQEKTAAETLAQEITSARAEVDWRAACRDPSIDAVIIAVSHNGLSEIALEAVKYGKHVLVEKPAGRNANEFKMVVGEAKRNGVLVKVGYNHRFHPAMIRAKSLVDRGKLGPLMFIRGRYGHGGRIGYEKEWRAKQSVSGGGELIDQGSHLIDLSLWFLGPLNLNFGKVSTMFWDMEVEDNCFLSLANKNNQQAWLHASWTEWKNIFSFEVYGRDGKLEIHGLGGSYGTEKLTFYKMLPEMGPPETTTWEFPFPDNSWRTETQEFLNAITESRNPIGTGEEALEVLEIIDEIYRKSEL